MKELPFIQTSVFVDDRYSFTGNQLATFYDREANSHLTKEEMQGIALEMNFSETTFILDSGKKNCTAKVRIFTPGSELDFAGHPTLGTSFVLKDQQIINKDLKETTLELGIGPIKVKYNEDETISMFQSKPKFLEKIDIYNELAAILGISKDAIRTDIPIQIVSTGFPFMMIPIQSLEEIKSISLNAQLLLEKLSKFTTSEIVTFTTETEHQDSHAHVRMFAPSVGVLEDPATGSAAGPLGAYLEYWEVLKDYSKGDKISLEQGYEIKRPSRLIVNTIYENEKIVNVEVSGKTKKTAGSIFYL